MTIPDKAQNILTFWFDELTPQQWFTKSDQLDELGRKRRQPVKPYPVT
jgi:uncharacterized protein (DUF924 family)